MCVLDSEMIGNGSLSFGSECPEQEMQQGMLSSVEPSFSDRHGFREQSLFTKGSRISVLYCMKSIDTFPRL